MFPIICFYLLTLLPFPFAQSLLYLRHIFEYYGYWVLLGIASSIGLGTGLHTFVLFLGPFIAKQTMAHPHSSILDIYFIIAWESFFWGAGTAIGELPPYFIARGARLAGQKDEEFDELEHLKQKTNKTFIEKAKYTFFSMLNYLGFWGILLAASIPNPLFDLAGITCGHFLVPFATFFSATFIGKAVIKAGIQSFFVIALFSSHAVEHIHEFLSNFNIDASKFLHDQKKAFGSNQPESVNSGSLIQFLWNGFILLMISYFVLSIIEALANKKFRERFIPAKET